MKEARLVYSSDPTLNQRCSRCKELKSECCCRVEDDPKTMVCETILRLEKRAGKTVTLIERLPWNDAYLKTLTALLKKKCGAGGTYSLEGQSGTIEIQGDKREMLRSILCKEGIRVR